MPFEEKVSKCPVKRRQDMLREVSMCLYIVKQTERKSIEVYDFGMYLSCLCFQQQFSYGTLVIVWKEEMAQYAPMDNIPFDQPGRCMTIPYELSDPS